MVVFSIALFCVSFLMIVTLFGLKYWEAERGVVIAPTIRMRSDRHATYLKKRMAMLGDDLAKLGPVAVLFLSFVIHESALGFASLARASEAQAHRIADLVSHRRAFVPREPRSEFLKQVIEYKTGNGETGESHV